MKLKLLPSQVAALLVTTVLTAALTSGCGKANQTTEQAATNAAAEQTATSETTEQGTTNEAAKQAATAAALKWLTEIDNGQYGQSWQDAAVFFQNAVSQQKWESALAAVRKPLGDLGSRNLTSAQYATQLPGAPDGQYVVMQFNSSFANKKSAVETVTFMLEKDGPWKASGYYIK
jgi:Protein of unknown function (DUF4019)